MARFSGLHFIIATAILQIQACDAAAIRKVVQTTTAIAETTPQVSTMADSTIPQDIIAQTTLPPILYSTATDTATTTDIDTDTTAISTDRPESIGNQTTPGIQPQLSGQLLPRSQPKLGWKSTMADTSTMDSDTTLVPTTQLVPVSESVPEVGEPAMDHMVKKNSKMQLTTNEKTITTSAPESVNIPSKVQQTDLFTVPQPKSKVDRKEKEQRDVAETKFILMPETTSISRKVQETVSIPKLVPEQGSFVPPTVQIMAYVIDALWEKEHKNLNDGYKVTEDVNDTKEEWEDDDMSKPVFQTNVPIVNSESVPMRMHMDIVPQGFPEDLEGPMYYPDYYDDKDTKNDLGKFTEHPWGKDNRFGDSEDVEDDVGTNADRFATIQQQMKFFRYSDTVDKLVELHKDLSAYARNHDIRMHKGFSSGIMAILRKNTDDAAAQLKTVISMISDEIDDEPLDSNLKKFLETLSKSDSETSLVLSSLPALHYS